MLPLAAKPDTTSRAELPITAEDLRRVAGVYRNGEQKVEIAARDGGLYLKRGNGEDRLVKRSETRFSGLRGGEYVVVAGPGGTIEYVNSGSRSFARVW